LDGAAGNARFGCQSYAGAAQQRAQKVADSPERGVGVEPVGFEGHVAGFAEAAQHVGDAQGGGAGVEATATVHGRVAGLYYGGVFGGAAQVEHGHHGAAVAGGAARALDAA
nr:hypothetical protein [Tanacetum cinerariifolium]